MLTHFRRPLINEICSKSQTGQCGRPMVGETGRHALMEPDPHMWQVLVISYVSGLYSRVRVRD